MHKRRGGYYSGKKNAILWSRVNHLGEVIMIFMLLLIWLKLTTTNNAIHYGGPRPRINCDMSNLGWR